MSEQRNDLSEAFKPRELEILRLIADGLTNQEISEQLFIAVTTVRWYNKNIYSKLGVHSRTLAVAHARELGLLEADLPEDEQSYPGAVMSLHNFPAQLTQFVGREREIAKVRQLLTTTRLLTLTGPGGTGKTRLALQLAQAVQDYFPDDVWFVPLATVRDPQLVPNALASALGVAEEPGETIEVSLVNHLRSKQLLLVIDNFEHVMPAASILSKLLVGTERAKMLVTSREVLRLYGEQEYPVPPLTVPDWQVPYTPEELVDFEAVALFLERAQAVDIDFHLHSENAATVARLCTRLDGLPLALELAAARIKVLPLEHILDRLEGGLDILGQGPRDAPARQRTLRATIDWRLWFAYSRGTAALYPARRVQRRLEPGGDGSCLCRRALLGYA